ncbi:Hypothetical protein ETEE_0213 [Edwardsiella anguillarum ET080813]|uniref:Uncharacterized protein n=1 Tax=Edwardsiella anguillarum ET080813 TaxID=667120 RepID=A0A076LLY8_9GAMM|nr:Hypothetical protein ETEE_0213 [Edwardsiella anguillarum ET080813]
MALFHLSQLFLIYIKVIPTKGKFLLICAYFLGANIGKYFYILDRP